MMWSLVISPYLPFRPRAGSAFPVLTRFFMRDREIHRKIIDREIVDFRVLLANRQKEANRRKPNSYLIKYAHVPKDLRAEYEAAHILQVAFTFTPFLVASHVTEFVL